MSAASILSETCDLLTRGAPEAASELLRAKYPLPEGQSRRQSWPPARAVRIFVRDGFTERYDGKLLVYPGALRALSLLLPVEFPYHPNWRQSETHPAYWELYPTIDHVVPLARGGADDEGNMVTTSMLRNGAKGNCLVEELGWSILPRSTEPWDGLLGWFVEAFDKFDVVRTHRSTREWYRVAKHAT